MISITDPEAQKQLLYFKINIMGESNMLLYIVAGIVIIHIVAGIGYLLYKIGKAPAPDTSPEKENDLNTV